MSDAPASGQSSAVYLGLGASLGDRRDNLRNAIERLERSGVHIRKVSPIYESPHLGLAPGDEIRYPAHLNLVVEGETSLTSAELLDLVHKVEAQGGRVRGERWGPRTIDIDILTFGSQAIANGRLTIPHPGIAVRGFVARPLVDIAPEFQLPDGTLLRDRLTEEPLRSQKLTLVSRGDFD
jgi:2-amino-4-hydroxy-6-hydroxymethyldihydropteridine diphosphokinase